MADADTRKPDKRPDLGLIPIGLIVGGFGLYLALAGTGLIPPPRPVHAPGFIIVCAGLALFGGGGTIVIHGLAGAPDRATGLPADTPRGLVLLATLGAVTAFAPLAIIATWIALGSGDPAFSGTRAVLFGPLGDTIGRTVFGVGAAIAWVALVGIVRASAKKLRAQPVRHDR